MTDTPDHLPAGTLLHARMYRIVRFIAAGGFGCTYEAEHVLLEKRVAIKEFFMQDYCNRDADTHRVTVGTKSMLEMVDKYKRKFIGEAKALSVLDHEGIVGVSDVFEENGTAYFVMDYVDGQSLAGYCKNGPLLEKHALYYIRQVCEALAYVHDHNRLHLDIKPGNIMVKSDGSTVLIDFGASKQYDAASGDNNTTLLGYTPGYAPLEQMNHNVQQFFPATDIYALGATLYCLLTGHTPQSPADRLNDEENNLALPANISAATRHAVEQAMQIRKKDRPQSVREFMALLDAAIMPTRGIVQTAEVPINGATHGVGPQLNPKLSHDVGQVGSGASQDCRNPVSPVAWTAPIPQPNLFFQKHQSYFKKLLSNVQPEMRQIGPALGAHNGYNFVDLGLSVKWATQNVGASRPEDFGAFFAWGETKTKGVYKESNWGREGHTAGDISGNAICDAARANWGGRWRMPTKAECDELVRNCALEWGMLNGVVGMLFTSRRNGNSLFLPAAGRHLNASTYGAGEYGRYWASNPDTHNAQRACGLYFEAGDSVGTDWYNGYNGCSVRPVIE